MSRLKRPRPRRRLRRLLSLLSARTAWTDAQESAGYTAPTNLSCNPNANARGVRRQHVYSLRRQRRPSRHSTKETALPNGDSRRACSARVWESPRRRSIRALQLFVEKLGLSPAVARSARSLFRFYVTPASSRPSLFLQCSRIWLGPNRSSPVPDRGWTNNFQRMERLNEEYRKVLNPPHYDRRRL